MTKQEKIKAWLIEQGYVQHSYVTAAYFRTDGRITAGSGYDIDSLVRDTKHPVVGVFKDKEFVKIPDFQDDQPASKDKALQEYMKGKIFTTGYIEMMEEINSRLIALEAANEKA